MSKGRQVDGMVLLDKPAGITSNAALQQVKRLFNARKAGHTGSLDPLATGLLPICLGEATKVSGFLLDADKSYRFVCRMGITTTTGDVQGEVVRRRAVGTVDAAAVTAVLARFVGDIEQIPPMYSALKHKGRRLYELARQGLEVERQPRRVRIHALQLLSLEGDEMSCQVDCSKGTYVRTLAEDVGEALGCGAHIVALRRIGVAPYDASQMRSLEALQALEEGGFVALDTALLPMDTAITHWPSLRVEENSAYYLRQGQALRIVSAPRQGWVRLYQGKRFLGIGEILDDGRVAPRRLLRQSTEGREQRTES